MKISNILSVLLIALALLTVGTPAHSQKMIISIDKFENEAKVPDTHFQTLRSRITDNIINTRKFEVVERQNLNKVLSERKLADAGLTSEETAPEAGQLKGAGYIIYGSVLSLGYDKSATQTGGVQADRITAKVELQLRFANAETATIVASKTILSEKSQSKLQGDGQTVSGNKNVQALEDAIRDAAKKATAALMELAYPAKIIKVAGNQIMVNLTEEATSLGQVYEVWDLGEEMIDPDTGESLGAMETLVGEIEVIRAQPKFCIAKPRGDLDAAFLTEGMVVRALDEEVLKQRVREEKAEKKKTFESRF